MTPESSEDGTQTIQNMYAPTSTRSGRHVERALNTESPKTGWGHPQPKLELILRGVFTYQTPSHPRAHPCRHAPLARAHRQVWRRPGLHSSVRYCAYPGLHPGVVDYVGVVGGPRRVKSAVVDYVGIIFPSFPTRDGTRTYTRHP